MIVRTLSATRHGGQFSTVEVEVQTLFGKPQLVVIGLPEKAIVEAKERITSALVACGVRIKAQRTLVNLAPADERKNGSSLELAIAVSLFKLYGLAPAETDDTLFIGELSLDGTLKPVAGAIAFAQHAVKSGYRHLVIPAANAVEASFVPGIQVHPLSHLREYLAAVASAKPLPTSIHHSPTTLAEAPPNFPVLSDILGQATAKRALEIVAAGEHHLLMTGPPGIGKTMLAKALASLLPAPTDAELLEILSMKSIGTKHEPLVYQRPFRAPHHTISRTNLIGGGSPVEPGEISYAHHGILFLDELTEFSRASLEALRQPLEDGAILLTRGPRAHQYPARFIFVGAANPCPCGYYQSTTKACRCSPSVRARYLHKLSGPLLDRIDVVVPVFDQAPISSSQTAVHSLGTIQARIRDARQRQATRFASQTMRNGHMDSVSCLRFVHTSREANQLLARAKATLSLSTRGYFNALRVAQTIADLAQSDQVEVMHIAEALQYRTSMAMPRSGVK